MIISNPGTLLPRRGVLALALGVATTPGLARAQETQWKPTRPINLIVPWAAGGATDQVLRVTAAELETLLGQTIVVIDQPGASGAIGTRSAMDAPHDGYTWTGGAVTDLGSYETMGSLKTRLTDWNLYLTVTNVPVLCVAASSPYKTVAELIEAMRKRPNAISVSTAGVSSSGHMAMDLVAAAAHITYRHVSYDGGNPAVVAAVSGEVNATSQLAGEEAEMIRGKMLRPLAAIGSQPLTLSGFGTIPAISDVLPNFTAPPSFYGIFIPKGVPDQVTRTMDAIWQTKIVSSDALKTFAGSRGALFAPAYGEAAQKAAFPAVQIAAWQMFDTGKAKVSPATVGIPKI